MASGRRNYRGRKINPTYYVFCEGQTEAAYVNVLKSHYRLPSIVIKSKVSGSSVSTNEIEKTIHNRQSHEKDKVFLMYDGDVRKVVDRLNGIDIGIKLITIPCIELWFMLHIKNQTANITSAECIRYLENCSGYKKSKISKKLKEHLTLKIQQAIGRAKALSNENPSSTIYIMLEELEAALRK
ncbi:MAG: RloB family protein [Bacteroidota bacterium]